MDSLKNISCPSWIRNCLETERSLVILKNHKMQSAVFRDYQKNRLSSSMIYYVCNLFPDSLQTVCSLFGLRGI